MSNVDPNAANLHIPYDPSSQPRSSDQKLTEEQMQKLRDTVARALGSFQEAGSSLKSNTDALGSGVKEQVTKLSEALKNAQAVLNNLSGNPAESK